MSNLVVQVRDLSKVYGHGDTAVRALKNINLEIARGDFVAIMGASGSGKSTLMNILGCLDAPSTGEFYLRDLNVAHLDENQLAVVRSRLIGFVFQSFNLIPRTSALKNVELPMAYQGISRVDRKKRAEEALASVGLSERMHHQSHELSGGQQQRVAIARAIVTTPAMILADEPTGALDSGSTFEILNLLKELNKQGTTVVVITHEEEVARAAQRVVRLRDGEIIEDQIWVA